MRLLLDTHVFLQIINGDEEVVSHTFYTLINHELTLSIASVWEIAIKINIGKLKAMSSVDEIFEVINNRDISLIPIDARHLSAYVNLPLIHRDPFDRLIIAQAMSENFHLVTDDKTIKTYPDIHFFE